MNRIGRQRNGSEVALLLMLAAAGCGSGDKGNGDMGPTMGGDMSGAPAPGDMAQRPIPDGSVRLSGAAAKGPLVLGSPVVVSPVDNAGNPTTGLSFPTQTTSDEGSFSLDLPPVGLAQLSATGFYYNEVSGGLSQAQLQLSAFANISQQGAQTAFLNLFTHLEYLRVKALLGKNMTLDQAVTQAETELRGGLGIGGASFNPGVPGNQMSLLAGDTDAAAYVFAIASSFVRAALIKGGGSVEAVLQERINTLQSAFASSGVVDADTAALLKRAQGCVRPSDAMSKLATRFKAISSKAVVPDINRALDSDGDGVPNFSDTCLRVANADQKPITDQVCASSIDATVPAMTSLNFINVVRAGDFNGDNLTDVVAIGTAQNGPAGVLWLGAMGGGFGAPLPVDLSGLGANMNTSVTVLQVRTGDADRDGNLDVLISYSAVANNGQASAYPNLVYLPGDGKGGLGAPVTIDAGIDPLLCGNTYCQFGQLCVNSACVSDCRMAMGCGNAGTCDQNTGLCACGGGPVCGGQTPNCVNGACSAMQSCANNPGVCNFMAGSCNFMAGVCMCGQNPACSGQTPYCVNNACVAGCNGGPACGQGQFCSNNGCMPGCGQNPPCAQGLQCQNGSCVAGCGGGGPCQTGQTCQNNMCHWNCAANPPCQNGLCDYGTGMCVNTCGNQNNCPGGQFCVNGACAQGCGPNPPCAQGLVCANGGQCLPNCGNGPPCPMNMGCVAGKCVMNCGMNPPCGQGQGCTNNNTCMPNCGNNPPCQMNQGCINGVCQQNCGPNPPCPQGQGCVFNNMCLPNCGNNPPCTMGTGCVNGVCQQNCGANPPCQNGQMCVNNSCQASCNGAFCQMSQTCVNNTCVDKCGSGPPCNAAMQCVYGNCKQRMFSGFSDFVLADVTGDGIADVVGTIYAAGSGQMMKGLDGGRTALIGVAAGKMAGGYAAPFIVTATAITNTDTADIALGDFDGVSGPDVVVTIRQGSGMMGMGTDKYWLVVLLNDGTGHFAAPANPTAALAGPFNARVAFRIGDVDGDQKSDLAILDGIQPFGMMAVPSTTILFGDGTGHFGGAMSLPVPDKPGVSYADCMDAAPPALGFQSTSGEMGLGDLNGDGKADLLVGQAVLLSTGRAFGAAGRLEGSAAGGGIGGGGKFGGLPSSPPPLAGGPQLIDIDGDGKAEAITASVQGKMQTDTMLMIGRVNPKGVHTW